MSACGTYNFLNGKLKLARNPKLRSVRRYVLKRHVYHCDYCRKQMSKRQFTRVK